MAVSKKVTKKKSTLKKKLPSPGSTPLPSTKQTSEIGLHEVGEALAISAISIKRELSRYQDEMGLFEINDFELEIPVKLRIDDIGQVMATVVSEVNSSDAIARLKIKINPTSELPENLPIIADQPLESLGVFNPEQIKQFKQHRIFSVEDLLRASRNTSTLNSLTTIAPNDKLDTALNLAGVITMPNLPSGITSALVNLDVASPKDFVAKNPKTLATQLSQVTGESITEDDVKNWQSHIKDTISLKFKRNLTGRPDVFDNIVIPGED